MRNISFYAFLILLLCSAFVQGQAVAVTGQVDMADSMRSNGKIYVVVGVLIIILFGLFAYLISIDRKVNRMEKSIEKSKNK